MLNLPGSFPRVQALRPLQEIIVAKEGGDFTSFAAAIAHVVSLGDCDPDTKPYLISVASGRYSEPHLHLIPGLTIQGEGAILAPSDPTQHFIEMASESELIGVEIDGGAAMVATTALVYYAGTGLKSAKLEDVGLSGGVRQIWCNSVGSKGILELLHVSCINGDPASENFLRVTGFGEVRLNSCSYRQDGVVAACPQVVYCAGQNAYATLDGCTFKDPLATDLVFLDDGCYFRSSGGAMTSGVNAYHVGPTPGAPNPTRMNIIGNVIRTAFTRDIWCESNTAVINVAGSVAHEAKIIDPNGRVEGSYQDDTTGSEFSVVRGGLHLGDTAGWVPMLSYTRGTSATGHVSGGDVTITAGRVVSVAAGESIVAVTAANVQRFSYGSPR
jgi:hypothetical protein